MASDDLTALERLQARVGLLLGKMPPRLQRVLSGSGPIRIDGNELEPGLQFQLRLMRLRGVPSLINGPDPVVERERIRRQAMAFGIAATPVGEVRELEIPGARGPMQARLYEPPDAGATSPLLLFLHGGGFVVGDLESHDEPCRLFCRHADIRVLAIDYARGPEQAAPAGLDDVLAAWRWLVANAQTVGADPKRLAIGGDSAGGNLAAVASQTLVRGGEAAPCLQVLIYPVTDLAGSTRSHALFAEGFFLELRNRETFNAWYLDGTGIDPADPRVSPARAEELSGLPPAILTTADFDPLRDEGLAYADALEAAGVPVTRLRGRGLIHAYINFAPVNRASRDATIALAGAIRTALSYSPALEQAGDQRGRYEHA
jgi:acetyl esterase